MFEVVVIAILIALAIAARVVTKRLPQPDVARKQYQEKHSEWKARSDERKSSDRYYTDTVSDPEPQLQIPNVWIGRGLKISSWSAFAVAVIIAFASTFVQIPPKDIAVVTTLGAPTTYYDNGPHFKAPWQDITLMDGAIQTDTHNRPEDKPFNVGCIQVRIAHQIVACANMYVKWQVLQSSVDSLYKDYRAFDNIRDSLVDKNVQTALNAVFANYDPLAVDPKTGQSSAPELATLSKEALDKITLAVKDKINVSELGVTVMNYDDATQSKINALQGQVAQTRIAEQSVQTADQQAAANQKLSASVSKDPNVLVSKCLDTLDTMVAKGQPVPAGFSCWPGGNSAIVVPSGTTAKK